VDTLNTTSPVPGPLRAADLAHSANRQTAWLWHGYLARGSITLLTSQWKTGKTTLVSLLLHQMKAGGTLTGLPVRPGNAIIVTEESPELWYERSQRFDYADHVHWFCRPFRGKPREDQWLGLLDQIHALHRQLGVDLLVIDPLATFLPGNDENNAVTILNALVPLQHLTTAGLAVLLLHHPRKGAAPVGQAARGSGALQGCADILMEMHWFSRADNADRRRQLLGWSRFSTTPRQQVIELNEAGTDYAVLGTRATVTETAQEFALHSILAMATHKLTVREIREQWPPDVPAPNHSVLWRRLTALIEKKLLYREGAGNNKDPFRYWLPERESVWRQDPLLAMQLDEAAQRREMLRHIADLERSRSLALPSRSPT
jgi:hypothetical protein